MSPQVYQSRAETTPPDRSGPHPLQIAAEIVIAYVTRNSVRAEVLPDLVWKLRIALSRPLAGAPSERADPRRPTLRRTPAVPVAESITPDYLVSLEDGKKYRSLRRHLMARYGFTPDDYRRRWGLPADYPMVAPNYARQRSEVARRTGLGRVRRGSTSVKPKR